ncbi:RHS repeat domain-containing protein [Pirellulaceae bacterium SH467]
MSNYGFTSAGTSYDDEDRLTGFARASGTFTQSWSLTSVGDWNSITTNGTAQNRTHGPTHLRHLCPDCSLSSSSLSPPASGLLPDFDNKLKSADVDNNGSNDVTFQYDALGRRVARQGTSGSFVYVQHDQQTIADYGYGDAPSSPTHRYVVASYIDEPVVRKAAGTSGTIHYYHRNQQYSITAVTTSTGSVAERYAYTAFGQPTILDGSGSVLSSSAINNRYTYTGREWDQTLGLYHFRARWMSGLAGRFMGRDPIGYDAYHYLNLFANYLLLSKTDPTGNSPCLIGGAIGGGVGMVFSLFSSYINGEGPCQTACKAAVNSLAGGIGGCFASSGAPPCLTGFLTSLASTLGNMICDMACTRCLPDRKNLICNAVGTVVSGLVGCLGNMFPNEPGADFSVEGGVTAAISSIFGTDVNMMCAHHI